MSLNSALAAGTSGLIANAGALAAISDNIANVNTVGYKRTVTDFDPLVKASSNAIAYNAGGVNASSRQLITSQGLLATSSAPTDIGISGDGFFVVTTKSENLTPTDAYLFTRAGAFSPDENGYLQNTAGYYLQGWPVDADGSVNANPTDLANLETINIGAIGGTAEATTRMQFNANLDAEQAAHVGAYAVGDLATYSAGPPTVGTQPHFTTSVQVFDSLGQLHNLTFAFLKRDPTTNPNEWYMEVFATPASDVVTAAGNGVVLSGNVTFSSNGAFDLANSTFSNTINGEPGITLGASGGGAADRWADPLGVSDQTIMLDFGGPNSTGGLTQLASPSAVASTSVNGSVFGDLSGVEIDNNGFVTAKFNNGVIKPVYQLPVATFINANGLAPDNGGSYRVTPESGLFTMKQPGVGGAGLISPNSLESSNVDLATEFTGLITTQRAYSAASKIITTADEMMAELISMKR